jgi:hypothetical protein
LILIKFLGVSWNLNEIWTKSIYFMELFPKILWRIQVNILMYSQYGKDFFLLNGILLKLLTISSLYWGILSLFSYILRYFNEYKRDFERFESNIWNFDQLLLQISRKYKGFQQFFKDSTLIFGNLCNSLTIFLLLFHFNKILTAFMIIIRNSKLILTFFNLIHITSNKIISLFQLMSIISNILSNISLKNQDF